MLRTNKTKTVVKLMAASLVSLKASVTRAADDFVKVCEQFFFFKKIILNSSCDDLHESVLILLGKIKKLSTKSEKYYSTWSDSHKRVNQGISSALTIESAL